MVLNTLGTKRVLELCTQMLRLKVQFVHFFGKFFFIPNCFQSVIHVSTAYSNADKKEVEEIVYPPPHDPQSIINCIEALPADAIEFLQSKLLVCCNYENYFFFSLHCNLLVLGRSSQYVHFNKSDG